MCGGGGGGGGVGDYWEREGGGGMIPTGYSRTSEARTPLGP